MSSRLPSYIIASLLPSLRPTSCFFLPSSISPSACFTMSSQLASSPTCYIPPQTSPTLTSTSTNVTSSPSVDDSIATSHSNAASRDHGKTLHHPCLPLLLGLLVQAGIHRQSFHHRRNLNIIAYLHTSMLLLPHVRVHPVSLFFHLNQPSTNLNLVLASKIFQTTVSTLPPLPAFLTLLYRLVLLLACIISLLFPLLTLTLTTIDTVRHV